MLIDEEGKKAGVVALDAALALAKRKSLDLVEISPTAKPPVCKLLDYGKYRYRESKKRHEAKVRQKHIDVKEVKFHLVISEADYEVKLRNAKRFLGQDNRVKASIWFRGREISKQEIGLQRLQRFAADLAEVADVEQQPNLLGKSMSMLLVPKRKKKSQAAASAQASPQNKGAKTRSADKPDSKDTTKS